MRQRDDGEAVDAIPLMEADGESETATTTPPLVTPAPSKKGSKGGRNKKGPRGEKSIIHNYFADGKVKIINTDVEHCGPRGGLIQISAEIITPSSVRSNDEPFPFFNEYVKPPPQAIWDSHATSVSGLTKNDARIKSADPIDKVWARYVAFIEEHVPEGYVGVLAAWSGKSCDMEWFYRLTRTKEFGDFYMPARVDHFMDPKQVIHDYTGCKLNQRHSKLESFGLGDVYEYITNKPFEEAHDSLADTRAQTDINQ